MRGESAGIQTTKNGARGSPSHRAMGLICHIRHSQLIYHFRHLHPGGLRRSHHVSTSSTGSLRGSHHVSASFTGSLRGSHHVSASSTRSLRCSRHAHASFTCSIRRSHHAYHRVRLSPHIQLLVILLQHPLGGECLAGRFDAAPHHLYPAGAVLVVGRHDPVEQRVVERCAVMPVQLVRVG
ncbi:hypothetical protein SAMN02744124_02548 [Paenibacillus barengoltzii J12]|uniref:Uncharacterized protein n=1 Tax=Paenibacillus barengoltzii J12 TaxID=935846 RepID=A0ABY1LYK2_9BACL|nr:hypothetical protein SAMN02744124_02548 [Paenibacillus barengoltzii J12]